MQVSHCVVPYREFFWSVFSHIRTEYVVDVGNTEIRRDKIERCRKIRTRKTSNTDTFHAVLDELILFCSGTLKLKYFAYLSLQQSVYY